MSRQSAQERCSPAITSAPDDALDHQHLNMKRLAYLRLRNLSRHRGHLEQPRLLLWRPDT
jgi:hypothetical protein